MDIISFNEAATANGRIEKFIENPDSNSGVLTQPKVIEAGETVTIKSGRQAILADTVVDGDLIIEAGGDVFVPAGAGFSDLDQRIDTKLDKDFSSLSDKPTPVDTDNLVLQETGGLLKKLSFANLKLWILSLFNPSITGTVSFNSTTNNISLTDIVTALGLEIGDVIQISGATDSKNNSEFTVEVITDANNIIVNQGHANKGSTKNVATRASDTGVTVKLLVKYYNAPPSLGRDYVDMVASRAHNTNYLNNTKREMLVSVAIGVGNPQGCQAYVDSKRIVYTVNALTSGANTGINFTVPNRSTYLANNNGVGEASVSSWYELR